MSKKVFLNIVLAAVLGSAVYYFTGNWQILTRNPASSDITFEYPSFGASDTKGNYYVIDKSRRRVISSDNNGVVLSVIEGGSKEPGNFFYANEVTADEEGRIYILNWVLDKSGFFMDREEILRYRPDGSFDRVIYSKVYDEQSRVATLSQRGQLGSLSVKEGAVSWFDIDKSGIWSYALTLSSGTIDHFLTVKLPDANMLVSNAVRANDGTIVYVTKKGKIIEQKKGLPPAVRYSADSQNGLLSIPWNVGVDKSGSIYFSDLENRNIMKIPVNGKASPVLSRKIIESQNITTDDYTYYRFSVRPDGMLTTCNDLFLVALDSSGKIILNAGSFKYPDSMIYKAFMSWLFFLAGIISFVFIGRIFYVDVMNRKIPDVMFKAMGVITVTGVSAVLISSLILQNFSARYQKEALNKIAQMVQIIPKVIDASGLEKITRHEQFLEKDYLTIRENLQSSLNYNKDEWNNSYYFVLYRVINERLYGFMYNNGDIGIYYPFSYFDDPEGVYQRAYKGEIATEQSSDEWGSWLYGIGPIYNKEGKVIALLEIGADQYSFTQENNRLIREVILDVVTMLVIFVLAMIEATFFLDMLNHRERRIILLAEGRTLRQADNYTDAFLARPITFIFYTALTMSIVFIPLMMEKFYHPIPGLSKNLILGLPISGEMFFFGIASIFSGPLILKRGWRFVAQLGFAITGAGLIASGMSSGMISFLIARGVTGLGSGLFFMSMRGLINSEGMREMREEAYSHFYSAMIVGLSIGAVVGGFVADKFDYATVFYIAFAVLVFAFLFNVLYFKKVTFMEDVSVKTPVKGSLTTSFKSFFSDPLVIGFFLLIIIPGYVASTYLTYFFPIFAEAHGVSSSNVGRLFILNGLFVIYLGPVLSRFFSKQMSVRSAMVLGASLWAVAILVSAITGNIAGAVITIIIMGITEGFCVSAQNSYFLDLKVSKAIGEDQAVGYFEMVAKFAETLGPILFGLAIILGQFAGLSLIAAGIFGLAAIYVLLAKKKI